MYYSNTTLVKVKYKICGSFCTANTIQIQHLLKLNFAVRVRYLALSSIQIQHLLKLNARKVNLYDFHYTIKSINIQEF